MNCSSCGYELTEGAAFCDHCGTPIGEAEPVDTPQPKTGDGMAVASLVCGIVSWGTCGGFLVLPIIGLFLGIFGLKSRQSGMAIAGIACNAFALLLLIIISLMFSTMLLPAIQREWDAVRKAAIQDTKWDAACKFKCTGNEKQIILALHEYYDKYGAFPPLYTVDGEGRPLHSWRVLILPFISREALYNQIRLDEPWDSEYNRQFHDTFISTYYCPGCELEAHGRKNNCTYSVIAGEVFVPAKKAGQITGKDYGAISDERNNTIAIIEVQEPFCWMDPTADVTLDELVKGINGAGRVGSSHSGGCTVGLLDCVVIFIPDTFDTNSLRAMGTHAGGEEPIKYIRAGRH